jgi:putative oxidoreductase
METSLTRLHQLTEQLPKTKASLLMVPIGRVLFSLIFILAGFNHFTSGSISYADSMGVPAADMLVPISGLMAIIGGVSVLVGMHARTGATILLLFLLPVTSLMHPFWTLQDPQHIQVEFSHFLKNLSLIGTTLIIAFYGGGPFSFDNRRAQKQKKG